MPPPMPPPIPGVNATVRKNYDPKSSKQTAPVSLSDQYLISPLTGEKIPVESMASHMKISLLDPRWKEQKEKAIEEKRQQEQVFAEGTCNLYQTFVKNNVKQYVLKMLFQ